MLLALVLASGCSTGREVGIEQTPAPVRAAILAEAAGDPIVRITQGHYAGRTCYTVAVERPTRTSWYSVDESGTPCE